MANPGTAVTTLWNVQTDKTAASVSADDDKVQSQSNAFKGFFKEQGLQRVAEQSGSTQPKVTTIATLVSSLSSLVGSTGTQPQQGKGIVTAFIARPAGGSSSMVSATANSLTSLPRPIIVAPPSQQMILPKPSQSKQIIPTTPSKSAYGPNAALLTSPILASPVHSWGNSPSARKRRPDFDIDFDSKRRRTPNRLGPEKGGKGLRHFSMKVCEKVQQKGITSYNEVADELVQEFSETSVKDNTTQNNQLYDQKNIRRRVYDALNVLMAMNIISKEKKEIKWVGLPTNSAQECQHLEDQKKERLERIQQKQQQLQELIVQQIAFKNLVERNKTVEKKAGPPLPSTCIHLPFIIVNTSKKTVIDCSISSDKSEYLFNFDEAFEIHDDIEVLKRMGLSLGLDKGDCSDKNLRVARNMVPKALEPYVVQMANGTYGDIDLIEVDRNQSTATPSSPLAIPMIAQPSTSMLPSSSKSLVRNTQFSSNNRTDTPSPSLQTDSETDNEVEEDDDGEL